MTTKTNGHRNGSQVKARPTPQPGAFVSLPGNIEAEEALLGALLIDEDRYLDVGDRLRPEDFYIGKHQFIYEAIVNLVSTGARVDLVSVAAELERRGQIDDVGGPVFLSDLCASVGFTYNAPHYADLVYRESVRRQVIQAATKITQETYQTEEASPDAILSMAQEYISALDTDRSGGGPSPIRSAVCKFWDKAETVKETERAGLKTGIPALDKRLGGLQKGKLYLVAGRPGMGKSGLAVGVIRYLAELNKRVLYFSLEMPEEDVVARLVAQEARVAFDRLYSGELNAEEWQSVAEATVKIETLPIRIDDEPLIRMSSLKARAMREALRDGVDLIVVDHFGLSRSDRQWRSSSYEEGSDIADGALDLAKSLHVPVLGLVQLSRGLESRTPDKKRPTLADLRDSGKWEENADAVVMVYRDEVYNPDTEFPNIGELIIAKNRGGKTGAPINVYWKAPLMEFRPLEMDTVRLEDL